MSPPPSRCSPRTSLPPRSWAERAYRLTRYTRLPRGGHFAAHEEPALLADDITAFYRGLRPGAAAPEGSGVTRTARRFPRP
ncbi:hypothetical protein ACIGZH_07595 [Streptomyces sp. NPDC058319]|uniref:hypothetical protein n=1 Tax=unclassified Streptomyces TaxID=2593676 RepID=UPI0036E7A9A1